jgi:hypothetical protein
MGASMPIDVVQALVLVDPLLPVALLLVLLLLLLLQAATASVPTAAATMTRRPFIGYASISGISHYVGSPIERTAFRLMACRQVRPPQWADFVPLIKSPPFTLRQGTSLRLGWQL